MPCIARLTGEKIGSVKWGLFNFGLNYVPPGRLDHLRMPLGQNLCTFP